MLDPSYSRLKKVFGRTLLILGLLYFFVSLFSYLSLGEKSMNVDLFLFRPVEKDESDILMIIMRYLLVIGVLLGGSLNLLSIK